MSYTYAQGKSERDLVSYQSVRGAETKAIYESILGPTPLSEVRSNFVRPDDDPQEKSVDDTVTFLQATDFVDRPSERTIERIDGQPFEDAPFELQMFHHLSEQEGSQDHFMRIHEVIADGDTVFYDKENLLEDVKRELGSYRFDWTVQKIETWYNLMSPFGLVSVRDNQEILTSPAPRVVYDLLEEFQSREGTQIRAALDWVEENFFSCYASRGGVPRVHRGLSDTLGKLLADDVLELRAPSDATHEVKVPSADANRVSVFELHERPERPSYQYPLESHEGVVFQ